MGKFDLDSEHTSVLPILSGFILFFTSMFALIWFIVLPSAHYDEFVWYESPFTPILFWSEKIQKHFSPKFAEIHENRVKSRNIEADIHLQKELQELKELVHRMDKETHNMRSTIEHMRKRPPPPPPLRPPGPQSQVLQQELNEVSERLKLAEIQKQEMASVLQRWEEDGKSASIPPPPGLQDDGTKLIIYGIFSTSDFVPERMQIRRIVKEQIQNFHRSSVRIMVKFVIGNNDVTDAVRMEQYRHEDIIILPVAENINEAKTYYYFKHLIRELRDHGPNAIIFKADHDTFICVDKLLRMLEHIPETSMAYIGRVNTRGLCGNTAWCPPEGCVDFRGNCWVYMSGGIYGVSLPLARAMMAVSQVKEGIEDLTVAQWIRRAGLSNLVELSPHENGKYWCHSDEGKNLWFSPRAGTECLNLLRETAQRRLCDK